MVFTDSCFRFYGPILRDGFDCIQAASEAGLEMCYFPFDDAYIFESLKQVTTTTPLWLVFGSFLAHL